MIENEPQEEPPFKPELEHQDLPMLVWLRGDEPHYEDFTLHADQVMQKLGIRRSRLNQISGRELRVGKARIEGYLRPIYRPDDVERYLEWVRPSSSHKKSSDILEQAREKLEKESEKIADEFSLQTDEIVRRFQIIWQDYFSTARRDFTQTWETGQDQVIDKLLKLELDSALFSKMLRQIKQSEREQMEEIQKLKKEVQFLREALCEVLSVVQSLPKQMSGIVSEIQTQRQEANNMKSELQGCLLLLEEAKLAGQEKRKLDLEEALLYQMEKEKDEKTHQKKYSLGGFYRRVIRPGLPKIG
ncbi:MAG: hypothetical protein KA436_00950 [Oligoflexales bacterium]|nr:hypothetical protein [Oligoflexales bacterium]